MEYIVSPVLCILSGVLQQKFGPKKVQSYSYVESFFNFRNELKGANSASRAPTERQQSANRGPSERHQSANRAPTERQMRQQPNSAPTVQKRSNITLQRRHSYSYVLSFFNFRSELKGANSTSRAPSERHQSAIRAPNGPMQQPNSAPT
jgi:hypothetical protein